MKSETRDWFEAIKIAGNEKENEDMTTQWELGIEAIEVAIMHGSRPHEQNSERGIAARYVLDNAYELLPTPSGIRPVVRGGDDGRYIIGYEAYCVYCGEVWGDTEGWWWPDIETAVLRIEHGVDCGVYTKLGDGRVVCGADRNRSGCWQFCECPDCKNDDGDEAKTIGFDQRNCTSKPWTTEEMEALFI